MSERIDSTAETQKHIGIVITLMQRMIDELHKRARRHDASKLEEPEKTYFDLYTSQLSGLTYDSDEYRDMLLKLKPGLDCHYAANRHHPEHFRFGVYDMTLIDVMEMLCDWMAATRRHTDGDIWQSIERNTIRFRLSDQLEAILRNTVAAFDDA